MKQVATLTKKNGEVLKGYWNGKQYGTKIYFNVSDSGKHADINWKKSVQIERSEIKSLNWKSEESNNMPKTVEGWMSLMAKTDR